MHENRNSFRPFRVERPLITFGDSAKILNPSSSPSLNPRHLIGVARFVFSDEKNRRWLKGYAGTIGHFDDPIVRFDSFVPETNHTNNMENKISAALTAAAVTNITGALATIRENLPFLINLTKEERQRLSHAVGDQTFITLSLAFAAQHPEALPATFNLAEYAKDGALLTSYLPIFAALGQLFEDGSDTNIALGSDLYSASLDVYAFAKANNRNGAYDAYIDSVKARFKKSPRTPLAPPAP
jgi:hypothetical protein